MVVEMNWRYQTSGLVVPGTGVRKALHCSGAPVNGTSGTFAGRAAVGALLVDIATPANRYKNTGTLASPTWTAI